MFVEVLVNLVKEAVMAKRNSAKKSKSRSTSKRTTTLISDSPKRKAQKPRNPYADHPLMGKGGVHQKSKSALRAAARRELKQLTRDGFSRLVDFFFKK